MIFGKIPETRNCAALRVAGKASETAGRALGYLGVPQRQLGGPWEGMGAETIMK